MKADPKFQQIEQILRSKSKAVCPSICPPDSTDSVAPQKTPASILKTSPRGEPLFSSTWNHKEKVLWGDVSGSRIQTPACHTAAAAFETASW